MKKSENLYAEVILSLTARETDRTFTYAVPEELAGVIKRGMRVLVPFGSRRREAYVVELTGETAVEPGKLKPIERMLDDKPALSAHTLELAFWMKEKYYTTLANCIRCLLPAGVGERDEGGLAKTVRYAALNQENEEIRDFLVQCQRGSAPNVGAASGRPCERDAEDKGLDETFTKETFTEDTFSGLDIRNAAQRRIIEFFLSDIFLSPDSAAGEIIGEIPVSELKETLQISDSPLNTLAKKNLIRIYNKEIARDPLGRARAGRNGGGGPARPVLTVEQQIAADFLLARLKEDSPKPALISGVTGSGKTEVYLRVIEEAIKAGKQAIMLVPEISLTPQTVDAFIARLGDKVTVTHSRLTPLERYDQ
ncbi:MAG: DEAD/DEAH box helicase family protein, partial [Defluviitaleaceae bacterium]|nr:DEAD/DEAH box helicase family protein [Defluviitaleaceae bacterium]